MNTQEIKPYQNSDKGKQEQVEEMFNSVSKKYDAINQMITFGMDKRWRNHVLKLVKKHNPASIVDIATGTGAMAILFSKTNAKRIVGIDISKGMVDVANQKIHNLHLQDRITTEIQNSEHLEFEDSLFDAASVTYGIRNFENLSKGLSEIYRVLNDHGVLVILETSQPERKFLKAIYLFYMRRIMPGVARLFSKEKSAYRYLSNSATNFPYGLALKQVIKQAGFKEVQLYPQFFGVSTIYYAKK